MKLGILGGSFDPPHNGHISISYVAIKKLNLNKVTWLISVQNSLKKNSTNIRKRIKLVQKKICTHKNITTNTVEKNYQISRSYDIIRRIKKTNRRHKLYWIMGSDCVQNFHKWHMHKKLAQIIPIIIIERSNKMIHHTKFFHQFKKQRIKTILEIKNKNNGWIFIKAKTPDISSTKIRKINSTFNV